MEKKSDPNLLPFKIGVDHEIPKWRATTFWTKEPETIAWIDRYLTATSIVNTFIDVGANIGLYSLYAAAINVQVGIIAVEPIFKTFAELKHNLILNNFPDRIQIIHAALSSQIGRGRMVGDDGRIGSSGSQLSLGTEGEGSIVMTTTGDEILYRVANPRAIIKIDTDGNEFDILRGFESSFRLGYIESVLVETTAANIDQISDLLASFGLMEDFSFSKIAGHSDHRRIQSGNPERTKIYSLRIVRCE